MNIKQHIINPISLPRLEEYNCKEKLYNNYIPASMYKHAQSNVVLEQNIKETVPIPKEAKDYIICELRSTIQHEAGHRAYGDRA